MIAKCGEVRIWHWAHKGHWLCDPWWENETEWHRTWKDEFPPEWQEIIQIAEDGERHIADVKTDYGWVIEFQNSPIKPEERRSREAFYTKLVWVVNGTRRKRDRAQLVRAWNEGVPLGGNAFVRQAFSDDCALLREWASGTAPIFFDLGDTQWLWWLLGAFYTKLVWVVNGTRRKRDRAQLVRAWNEGVPLGGNAFVRQAFSDDCALLREWASGTAPIFFDLGDTQWLWWLLGKSTSGWAYIHRFPRAQLIASLRSTATESAGQFDELVGRIVPTLIAAYESRSRAQLLRWNPLQLRRPRRHFRF